MVERFLVLHQPVCAALIELQIQDLMPHDSEVATMEVYWAIMKPITDITDVIGRERHVSISAVRPLIYKLRNCCLKIYASERSLEKAMKTAMYTKLFQYYNHNVQSPEILNIAAFLDPHFKSLSFLEEDKIATRLKVKEKICNLLLVSDSHLESTESDSTKLIELEVNEASTSVSVVSKMLVVTSGQLLLNDKNKVSSWNYFQM